MATPSPIEQTIIIAPSDAKQYLAKRDIDVDSLIEGLEEGFAKRLNCEVYDPVTAPATYQWAETNTSIRRSHCLTGRWEMANPENRPLVVHVEHSIQFGAVAGDSATGLKDGVPDFARKKGVATIQSVNTSNQLPLEWESLCSVAPPSADARNSPPEGEWFLLYFYDKENQHLRCEFSLATRVSEDGGVDGWHVRVLLKPIHPDFVMAQPDLFGPEDEDIEFTITRAIGE